MNALSFDFHSLTAAQWRYISHAGVLFHFAKVIPGNWVRFRMKNVTLRFIVYGSKERHNASSDVLSV